jgi:hypothetical protein
MQQRLIERFEYDRRVVVLTHNGGSGDGAAISLCADKEVLRRIPQMAPRILQRGPDMDKIEGREDNPLGFKFIKTITIQDVLSMLPAMVT